MCIIPESVNVMISSSCGKAECRLQMEAQRLSLSQIHAAQLELLQEETDAHTHSLELQLQERKGHGNLGEQMCSWSPFCASVFVAQQRPPQMLLCFDPSFMREFCCLSYLAWCFVFVFYR